MSKPTMENVFAEEDSGGNPRRPSRVDSELLRLAEQDARVVVLSADMRSSLSSFRDRFPHRYFEFGIAETNVISAAAGMATCGLVPYVVAMAPFCALKCSEQIRADVTSNKLPVRIVSRMSGLAMGYFGASHHAVEDLAIARSLTNLTVATAADDEATAALLRSALNHDGPIFIRVSEGTEQVYPDVPNVEVGRFISLREGSAATVIATGNGVGAALSAARVLDQEGVQVTVLDAAYVKPIDETAIERAAATTGAILTVEEHNVSCGLGAAVAQVIGRRGLKTALRMHGLPDEDLDVAPPAALLDRYGLTADGVAKQVRLLLADG